MMGGLGENLLATAAWESARAAQSRLLKTPRRTLFKSMEARKRPDVDWLSNAEKQRLLVALADQSFFDEVLALSSKRPTDELVTAMVGILDEGRPRTDAVEYAELLKVHVFDMVPPQAASAMVAQKTEEGVKRILDRLAQLEDVLAARARPTSGEEQALARYSEQLLEDLERDEPSPFGVMASAEDGRHADAIEELLDAVRVSSRVALIGEGGAGKSTITRAAAVELLESNYQAVLLDLKALPASLRAAADEGTITLNQLASSACSPQPVPLTALRKSEDVGAKTVWLLDGVNEVSPDAAEHLIELLLAQDPPPTAVVITDRRQWAAGGRHWTPIHLLALDPGQVEQVIDERFGTGTFAEMAEPAQSLLTNPFFLDLAIRSDHLPTATTQFGALDEFIGVGDGGGVVSMRVEEIDALGNVALAAAAAGEESGFDLTAAGLPPDLCQTLVESGTVIATADGLVSFRHQLFRDYFLAHALVRDERSWTVSTFDAVSHQANDVDSLLYATQLLKDRDRTDDLLTTLHDWNWFATVRCLGAAGSLPNVSEGIALAIAAMLAAKQFEVVQGSAMRAREWSRQLDGIFGWDFHGATSMEDLLRRLEEHSIDEEAQGAWFRPWRETFLGEAEYLDLAARLFNSNPLIAWAASNVLRLSSPTAAEQEVLRAAYSAAMVDEVNGDSVRWRIVHTIAQWKSPANTGLLFKALDVDPYMWVQYGAVRGLIEAAVEDQAQRAEILAGLRERLAQLQAEPASQLFWASRHASADDEWPAAVRPLLEAVVASSIEGPERSRNARRLGDFDNWVRAREAATPDAADQG
jgi:hypothetical protein